MALTPEQLARQDIDRLLEAAGWAVQDHKAMNLFTRAPGSRLASCAIREFPTSHGPADYVLYVEGKILGVIEAKAKGHSLRGVEIQSAKYCSGIGKGLPRYGKEGSALPFAYESTGVRTQFTNALDPKPRSREVFAFHRPEELLRLVAMPQLRDRLQYLPPISSAKLWAVQRESIVNLERSLKHNRPRALLQMATGSGKTYTAVNICYRLIRHAKAKRILFLVDRNNLGRQTLAEFQNFSSAETQRKFTEEYGVQHLRKNSIDDTAKVVITTIQRLFSMLKGDSDYSEDNEEESTFEATSPRQAVQVSYSGAIPIESFDFIVVDECHRSIYNEWRQVLDYFDAFLIGLTATPTPQTLGFFQGNQVQDYSHERAVADGVNVGYDVYRIRTEISEKGAKVEAKAFVPHRDRRTLEERMKEIEEEVTYTAGQLDRDVVNLSQIRLVIETFRERLFTEIFPGRREVPKTLIFAKTDLHAEDIVKIVREEFGQSNDFCVKITSKTTGAKPEDLLNSFRNDYFPRIAVTVDMIATGTDVKSLECLIFLRNIASSAYFEQMKGRGCRVIPADDLKRVSADASAKDRFVIVDAVGVCESDKSNSRPLDRKPTVSFESLLQQAAQGHADADLATSIAARLARLDRKMKPDQRREIDALLGAPPSVVGLPPSTPNTATTEGGAPREVAETAIAPASFHGFLASLFAAADPDRIEETRKKLEQALGAPTSVVGLQDAEEVLARAALRPLAEPQLREAFIRIKASLEQIIDDTNIDTLTSAGIDPAAKLKAESTLAQFQLFLSDNRDQLEALKLLYAAPHRAGLRYRHVKELAKALQNPPLSMSKPESQLWQLYERVEPEKVKGHGGDKLVDLIAIVRHALMLDPLLIPVRARVHERFATWLALRQSQGQSFSPEQLAWLEAIRDHIANSLAIEPDDLENDVPFSQMGSLGRAHALFGAELPALLEELNRALTA